MKDLLEHYHLLFAMTALTAAAILLKCICAIIYQVLLRETEQMASTKNKWLRSMHTKYEACYQLRLPVYHTDSFVQSYMARLRFFGCSLKALEDSDLFCALFVCGCTFFGMMCGTYYQLPGEWILIHSMTLLLFLFFLGISEFLFPVRRKRRLLHMQLLNHFENNVRPRLENQYLHPEERKAYQQEYFEPAAAVSAEQPDDNTFDPVSTLAPDMLELIASLQEESQSNRKVDEFSDAAATREKNTAENYQLVEEIIKNYF